MSSDTLREQIRRTPFHPVTLLLPSGKAITVYNPKFAMFTETGRTLVITKGDRFIFIEVATVETIERGKLNFTPA